MRRCTRTMFMMSVLAIGCKDDPVAPPPPPAPTVTAITVAGISSPGAPGATQQLTATASMSNNSSQVVTNQATWASSLPAVATVSVTGLVTAVGAGQTNVTASFGGKTGTFVITVAAFPSKLAFTVQPSSILAGSVIAPAVQVAVQDVNGNPTSLIDVAVTLTISTNPGGGTLAGGTTVLSVNGVATFSNLNISAAGTGYRLTAVFSGLTSAVSNPFDVTPGAASTLAFSVQPTNADPGAAITPAVKVSARDIYGNLNPAFTGNVGIAIGTNPSGGSLSGTIAVAAVAGVATFADLSIGTAGTGYTLTSTSPNLNTATSSPFSVAPGIATRLVFSVQPVNTGKDASITPSVEVTAQNGSGTTATGFAGNVAIALGSNPGGATLGGTLTVTAVNGVAAFPDLRLDRVATGYTLMATTPAVTGATSSAFNTFCPPDCWARVASLPSVRYGAGGGVVGDKLYVVGGNFSPTYAAAVDAYDPVTDTWSSKAPMLTARGYPGVAVVNGILYAIGGVTSSGPVGAVEAYNPATNTWTAKAPMGSPRAWPAVGVVNGVVYLAGGLGPSGGPLQTVEAYDPATDTWTAKADMPTARYVAAGGVVNGLFYAAGGIGTTAYSAVVEAYDPTTNMWSAKASLPSARAGMGVAVLNNLLYGIGGTPSAGSALNSTLSYNPTTNTWTAKANMLAARFDMAVGVINGMIYAAGGRTPATAVTEAYKP